MLIKDIEVKRLCVDAFAPYGWLLVVAGNPAQDTAPKVDTVKAF